MTSVDPSPEVDIPERRPHVEWVELDGEAVLYDAEARTLHRLNAGAAAVWAACNGEASTNEITRALEDAYSDPRVARDVRAVIALFRRLSLLQPSSAEAGPVC
jgi:hypothetical protein